jgi:hypothetical protein
MAQSVYCSFQPELYKDIDPPFLSSSSSWISYQDFRLVYPNWYLVQCALHDSIPPNHRLYVQPSGFLLATIRAHISREIQMRTGTTFTTSIRSFQRPLGFLRHYRPIASVERSEDVEEAEAATLWPVCARVLVRSILALS